MNDLDERQADRLRQVEALAKRDNESKENAEKWARPTPQQTPEEREAEVKEIIKNTMNAPRRSHSYFDPGQGRWINSEDEYTGDTGADLKTVIASLANPTNETFVKVDQLLYDYFVIIRHGETKHLTKNVEWILNDGPTGKVTVSYKDGSTWEDDCYSDELPMWLLLLILRAIQRRKKGDQKADEVIKNVRDAEVDYVQHRRDDSLKGVKLNVRPTFFDGSP